MVPGPGDPEHRPGLPGEWAHTCTLPTSSGSLANGRTLAPCTAQFGQEKKDLINGKDAQYILLMQSSCCVGPRSRKFVVPPLSLVTFRFHNARCAVVIVENTDKEALKNTISIVEIIKGKLIQWQCQTLIIQQPIRMKRMQIQDI
jgi:hypothetical protein